MQLIKNKKYSPNEIADFYEGFNNVDICLIIRDVDENNEKGLLVPQFENICIELKDEAFLVYMNGDILPASAFEGKEITIIEEIIL